LDFAAALQTLDSAYVASDKCAWFMSNHTLGALLALTDKVGRPLNLVQYIGKRPYIMGVRVRLCPSMPSVGPSATPVILGDGTYFATRLVVDDMAGVMTYTEAPGLAENGRVGLRTFVRGDGKLLYTSNPETEPCPFVLIRNAS
jgi:HK97 family phage major capsid protein